MLRYAMKPEGFEETVLWMAVDPYQAVMKEQKRQEMELSVKNLTKKYGATLALRSFDYRFVPGIYGILGANGAGKSTLMNLIADNIRRDEGEILWNGTDILKMGAAFRSLLGYMPQQQKLYENMTADTFLLYMARLKGLKGRQARQEIPRVLKLTNLSERRHERIDAFSGGMRQRLLLAQALLGDPSVLILDEPTAGLDPKERARLRDHIAKLAENRIVLLATHIVSDIEAIASDVLLLRKGELIRSGAPKALIEQLPPEQKLLGSSPTLEDVYLLYLGADSDD